MLISDLIQHGECKEDHLVATKLKKIWIKLAKLLAFLYSLQSYVLHLGKFKDLRCICLCQPQYNHTHAHTQVSSIYNPCLT
jgi:hypothetical protein